MGIKSIALAASVLILSACGGGGGGDGNTNTSPVIASLTATPNATDSSTPVAYNWNVSDIDGDTLTCLLDVDGDGTDDFTINDCANNSSQAHIFALSGNYTSRLSVNDGKGGSEQETVSVTITNPPGNNPPVIGSLTATPNATDSSTPVVYSWNVSDIDGDTLTCLLDVDGDGTDDFTINDCANNSSQAHTFAISGNYTSRLTVNDGKGGSEQQTVSVTITNPPGNNPPVIGSLTATPNATDSSTPVVYSWNVSDIDGDTLTCLLDVDGDGTDDFTINDCANNSSQAHTFTIAGNYTSRLAVNDGKGGLRTTNCIRNNH